MTSIHLTPAERQVLLDHYRRTAAPDVRLRAHILSLLDAGFPWATICAVLFCSPGTISRWKRRYEKDGVDAVLGWPRGRKRFGVHIWATLVVRWVLTLSPADFRFARSRWSCESVAVMLREDYRVRVGRETVRLWLRAADLVWRRPRPTIRPKDPDREAKLRTLRALLKRLPADETAVFMDEVDVNLNPKVGCMWMKRGQQAAVETPGNNEKRDLAGSIHWRTGRGILTEGRPRESRSAALFCRHLDVLRRAFRHFKVIHVLCDNAGTHTAEGSKLVRAYLREWGHRVKVHYLPKYSPDTNPIERARWRLHETVTRNHYRRTITTLTGIARLDLTIRRCRNPDCAAHKKPDRPEAEGRFALPRHEFGLDVVARVGRLRYAEHRSVPEITTHPVGRGRSIAERTVTNLPDRYDELLAVALTDEKRLKKVLAAQKQVILAIDGLQPDVGHEVLRVIRDVLSGEILLARAELEQRRQRPVERRRFRRDPHSYLRALENKLHQSRLPA